MEQPAVLYIDDEKSNLDVFESSFFRDYNLCLASSPEEALQQLERNTPDVLVSDQKMPGMSGLEFFRKAEERCPDVPKILVTAYGDMQMVIDAFNNYGIFKFITKPWTKPNLKAAINEAVAYRQQQSENRRALHQMQESLQSLANQNGDLPSQETYNPPTAAQQQRPKVTSKQAHILRYLDQGRSSKEIAEALDISPRTVDNHRANMMRQFQVNNVVELLRKARNFGYL